MKPEEVKEKFIELRARGYGYTYISKELNISRCTCYEWNKQFRFRIDQARDARLLDLYQEYDLSREARIKQLNKILTKIDQALDSVDFSKLSTKDLLEFRSKYASYLAAECPDAEPEESLETRMMRM